MLAEPDNGGIAESEFWKQITDLAAKTCIAFQPSLALHYRSHFPRKRRSGKERGSVSDGDEDDDDDEDDEDENEEEEDEDDEEEEDEEDNRAWGGRKNSNLKGNIKISRRKRISRRRRKEVH